MIEGLGYSTVSADPLIEQASLLQPHECKHVKGFVSADHDSCHKTCCNPPPPARRCRLPGICPACKQIQASPNKEAALFQQIYLLRASFLKPRKCKQMKGFVSAALQRDRGCRGTAFQASLIGLYIRVLKSISWQQILDPVRGYTPMTTHDLSAYKLP